MSNESTEITTITEEQFVRSLFSFNRFEELGIVPADFHLTYLPNDAAVVSTKSSDRGHMLSPGSSFSRNISENLTVQYNFLRIEPNEYLSEESAGAIDTYFLNILYDTFVTILLRDHSSMVALSQICNEILLNDRCRTSLRESELENKIKEHMYYLSKCDVDIRANFPLEEDADKKSYSIKAYMLPIHVREEGGMVYYQYVATNTPILLLCALADNQQQISSSPRYRMNINLSSTVEIVKLKRYIVVGLEDTRNANFGKAGSCLYELNIQNMCDALVLNVNDRNCKRAILRQLNKLLTEMIANGSIVSYVPIYLGKKIVSYLITF